MMKHLFKSTLVLLCALSFSGTYTFHKKIIQRSHDLIFLLGWDRDILQVQLPT